jgi:uncharacterized phage-like protein YoqJ
MFATEELAKYTSVTKVISGGAQGWDHAVAKAAIKLKIPLVIAVPFVGQELKWPQEAQDLYNQMLRNAETVIVSEGGYSNKKFKIRDEWMVDNADEVIALMDYNVERSGTRLTVEYAQSKDKPVKNVWDEWEAYKCCSGLS